MDLLVISHDTLAREQDEAGRRRGLVTDTFAFFIPATADDEGINAAIVAANAMTQMPGRRNRIWLTPSAIEFMAPSRRCADSKPQPVRAQYDIKRFFWEGKTDR